MAEVNENQKPMDNLVGTVRNLCDLVRSSVLYQDAPVPKEATHQERRELKDKYEEQRKLLVMQIAVHTIVILGDVAISLHRIADNTAEPVEEPKIEAAPHVPEWRAIVGNAFEAPDGGLEDIAEGYWGVRSLETDEEHPKGVLVRRHSNMWFNGLQPGALYFVPSMLDINSHQPL